MSGEHERHQEQVEIIVEGFKFELCHDCGGHLDAHVIAPGPFGNAMAWCKEGVDK